MPDPLFATNKPRPLKKRKLSQPSVTRPNNSRGTGAGAGAGPSKRRKHDSNDDNDIDDAPHDVFDDVDLEPPADDEAVDKDDETPAQKRLRLAKLYLENVKKDVAAKRAKKKGRGDVSGDEGGEDEDGAEDAVGWDAADVDREIIEARLQKDVVSDPTSTNDLSRLAERTVWSLSWRIQVELIFESLTQYVPFLLDL